jgi:glyoxylase-like metal-dependent hydrolase (beta-lactamase superfamily II)
MIPQLAAPGIWRLTTPLPSRPRTVHAYLVALDVERWMLVDGGPDSDTAWDVIDDGVRGMAGGWEKVLVHLVTHMHTDHIGLVARVREASGAALVMGELDAERAERAASHPEEEDGYREALLREHGVPRETREEILRATGASGPRPYVVPADHRLPCAASELPGAPGWTALWTPGHTAGHVSLLREADRVLVAGDAVLPRVTPTIGVNRQRPDPVGDYLATLDELARLDLRLALPGHGDRMVDVAGRLNELGRHTRNETGAVLHLLTAAPATAWEVAARRYSGRQLPASAWFQAIRETVAHLEHAALRGEVARERDRAGTTRFRS